MAAGSLTGNLNTAIMSPDFCKGIDDKNKEMNIQPVSEASAKLFYEQCLGTYSGHMANVPNNPTLMSICRAHNVKDERDFASFLRQVADKIEQNKETNSLPWED